MFQQVLSIQRDRQQFQSVDDAGKKHIKRWQSTERWQEGRGTAAGAESREPAAPRVTDSS